MTKFSVDPSRPTCPDCDRPMAANGKTGEGRKRYRCAGCGRSSTGTPQSTVFADTEGSRGYDQKRAAENAERILQAKRDGCRRFIVTCAANNSQAHSGFLVALESAAEYMGAGLIVIPVHYKNLSLFNAAQEYRKRWDERLEPYIVDEAINIGGGVVVDASIPIQATAANPLSSLHELGGPKWRIFGHPQLRMEPVAMPSSRRPKRVYTTGAVTQKSYSRSKLGAKAAFHHVYGALLVEVDRRDTAFVRQLCAEPGGGFYDLDRYFSPVGEVSTGHRATVLQTGDEHVRHACPKVKRATYGARDSIAATLRPKYIVRHDIFDAYAISHHHERDPLKMYEKHVRRLNDCRDELDEVVRWIDETTPQGSTNVLVAANHSDHLDQWLNRADANRDHVNALLILELQKAQREAIAEGRPTAALVLYLEPRVTAPTIYLDRNEPFIPGKGADYSQHGDKGANGARGSAVALARAALKMSIGHSHGARIIKSVYQAGKFTGRLEYEQGLSDHTNTHVVEYRNGKRTLVDIFSGKWRA